jgi:hypothetical protein
MEDDDYILEEPQPVAPAKPEPKPKPQAKEKPAEEPRDEAPVPPREKGGKNPRRGRVKKTAPDEPAKFEPGDALPPKTFDPADVAEEMKMWWEVGAGGEFILELNDTWAEWPEKKVVNRMRMLPNRMIAIKPRDNERLGECDRVILHTMENRALAKVLPSLSGYPAGIHDFSGRKFLVKSSPKIPVPEKGEWKTIEALCDRLDLEKHESGINQLPWFYSWCYIALDSLMNSEPGGFRQGHYMILAGPNGCGKGRIQNQVITGLLGGRAADPTKFMLGADEFNADLFEAEHLMMEELPMASQKTVDRNQFGENIKRVVANSNSRMRLMRTEPLTCNPFWRGTLSVNESPDVLRQLPLLRPGYKDKVLMFRVADIGLPMPTVTPAEQKAFRDQVAKEMPAFAWWLLNEFTVPEELLWYDVEKKRPATRFGFREFHHPDLVNALFDDTPEAELAMLIDKALLSRGEEKNKKLWDLPYPYNEARRFDRKDNSWVQLEGVWRGGYTDLQDLLEGEREGWNCNVSSAAKKLFRHCSADRLLGKLKIDFPTRFEDGRSGSAGRYWLIERPQVTPGGMAD